ncbi:hypothetical protein U1Q18_044850 [Sarracenia purpurea var. burkii]
MVEELPRTNHQNQAGGSGEGETVHNSTMMETRLGPSSSADRAQCSCCDFCARLVLATCDRAISKHCGVVVRLADEGRNDSDVELYQGARPCDERRCAAALGQKSGEYWFGSLIL